MDEGMNDQNQEPEEAAAPMPPTDWETRYEMGDTPWDKGAAHPGLLAFLKAGVPDGGSISQEAQEALKALGGNVLVPGCGLGADVRAIASAPGLAARSETTEVLGADIAPSALRRA